MKMPRKQCDELGCPNISKSGGKCSRHAGRKKCNEPGCPNFAKSGGKCFTHGGKICNESGCSNFVNSGGKCSRHAGIKKCNELGCHNFAKSGGKCASHGGGARCIELGCPNSAQDKTNKCRVHGGGKRCNELGCHNFARDKTGKCKAHGGDKRCPNCITWPDSRCGSIVYDGYCATCFKQLFPTDERSKVIYTHTKEIRVRNAINDAFEGFIHDKPLYTGQCNCTHRRRIDHRKLIGATLLCIETDEFGHAGYDPKDEELRYDDLYMIHSGKWIFIRFNPDGKGVDMVDKLARLMQEIQIQIERIENDENNELLEIIKLYY
jgi:hypothetical protein